MAVVSIMIKLLQKLPRTITVAFSGGVDSCAAVDFLSRNHRVYCAFFNHGTETSQKAEEFAIEFCDARNIDFTVGYPCEAKQADQSWEEYWRIERYRFLYGINGTVVTAHHLDDCVETYLFNMLHGKQQTIPFQNRNVVRPFLTTPKSELVSWCQRHNVPWIEDATNLDISFMRNYIRHELLPKTLVVNPGLQKVVKKFVEQEYSDMQGMVEYLLN